MSPAVLEQIIRSYMATDQPAYIFAWQGGEPALMGMDFYRRVVELQKNHCRRGAVVTNSLQTNGTLIEDELARHLSEHGFLVGVSLDGPEYMHDRYRRSRGGEGSFKEVMRGIQRLRQNRVEMNVLTVVTDVQVHKATELYRFLRDQHVTYHQYIPCVEFRDDGKPQPFTIRGEEWGDFLCEIYDEWSKWDIHRVSIRLFDSIIGRLVDGRLSVCDMGPDCRHYFVVEHNGDVYPCDFYVRPEFRLGNVMASSWERIYHSRVYALFGARKASLPAFCNRCEFLELCFGDCPRHRAGAGEGQDRVSWLCPGYRQFFSHALPGLRAIADELRGESLLHEPEPGQRVSRRKTARNAPCPCGSGLKYKRCCGR